MDAHLYRKYHAYMTPGWQFTGPGGVLCRFASNVRGEFWDFQCWGSLPGVPSGANSVMMSGGPAQPDYGPPGFGKSDQQGYGSNGNSAPGNHDGAPFTQSDYPPILPGQKLVVASSIGITVTCAVSGGLTACLLEYYPATGYESPYLDKEFPELHKERKMARHGFVLSPKGSWTF